MEFGWGNLIGEILRASFCEELFTSEKIFVNVKFDMCGVTVTLPEWGVI